MSTAAKTPPKPENVDVHCEDDLLIARIRGPYDEAVAWYLESRLIEQAHRYGYSLVIFHAHEVTTITREARRLMIESTSTRQDPGAGGILGASFTIKTLAQMLVRAADLLTKNPAALRFFDTEAEARAWLDKQRPRLVAEARAKAK